MKRVLVSVLFAITISCEASPTERIVGGRPAKFGEIPYIVSLRFNEEHKCGASILDANHVLTAAHCVYKRNNARWWTIQYGVTRITPDETNSIQVKWISIHPDYIQVEGGNLPNDVAVLTLKHKIPLSDYVQTVVLPKQNEPIPGNEFAVLAGWGRNHSDGQVMKNLQVVNIICYTDKDCKEAHPKYVNTTVHVCGGVPEGGLGQCKGDSGGPLNVNGVQVGIVSWSIDGPCAEMGPGVFAKVSHYIDWINEQRRYG